MFIKIINRSGKKRQIKREPKTFEEVRAIAEQIWGEEAKNSSIAYLDSDKELITIVNDDDWSVCMEEIEMMQEDKKVKKVVLKLIPMEDLTESIKIVDTSMVRSESEVTENADETLNVEENEDLKESMFDKMSESVVVETTPEPEPVPEEPIVEEPVEETPFDEEEDETQLSEWKMVEKPKKTQVTQETEIEEEDGDLNITEEPQTAPKEEEPSVFEEDSNPVKVTNTAQNDVVIDIKLDGNDLEAVRSHIMQIAPMMGFEVEKAEIQPKQPETKEPEMDESINVLEDMSMCQTERSSMTHDMRDEIQRMIDEKVREQLNRTLSSLNISNIQPAPQAPKEAPKPAENQVVHTGFTCDGCGVCPIVGVRYHSLHQKDYDLCENCEKTMHHEHPMLRLRTDSHRGLAHSRGWHAIKKILSKHEQRGQGGGCTRDRGNPGKFFQDAVQGFFRRPCPVNTSSSTNTNTNDNNANTNSCQAGPVGQIFRHIRQSMDQARGRHRNLCHVRVRNESNSPAQQVTPQVEIVNHPRFNEFKKVFTNASDQAINDFLYGSDHIADENELYNMAIAKFLE